MKKLTLLTICSCFLTFVVSGQANSTSKGNNEFAIELYKKLFEKKSNVFVSPYSISAALAMTYAGARGNTEKQMSKVMHYDINQLNTHKGFSELSKSLSKLNNDSTIKLSIANALWKSESWGFKEEFLGLTKQYYNAAIYPLKGAGPINTWADKNTHGKIKEIVKESDLSDARLVLTNAIYFKGEWLKQFGKDLTRESKFTTLDRMPVMVMMMHREDQIKYCEDENNQVVELPYKGETMSMTFILPKEQSSIVNLAGQISTKLIADYDSKLFKQEIKVFIPKFSFTSEFHLAKTLPSMGMSDAFIPGKADFSGMSNGLSISDVIHKAFIEVNEQGSEAAAVTAVIMRETSIRKEVVFNANRPFMILIRDKQTGSILFMGSVMNPAEK